jgi:hypothetical protein
MLLKSPSEPEQSADTEYVQADSKRRSLSDKETAPARGRTEAVGALHRECAERQERHVRYWPISIQPYGEWSLLILATPYFYLVLGLSYFETSVRHRADICALRLYNSRMAHYTFRIRQGSHSSDIPIDLTGDNEAWDEAAGTCSDMIRDTIARLGDSPEWRLEVADGSGTIRHLFRLTAETFDK